MVIDGEHGLQTTNSKKALKKILYVMNGVSEETYRTFLDFIFRIASQSSSILTILVPF